MSPGTISRASTVESNTSSGSSTSSEITSPFSRAPLIRRTVPSFPPHKYVAVAAQVVFFGISKLPMVARVTIVDYRGNIALDTYVRPVQPVSDYRTAETGLTPFLLAGAPDFRDVQRQVAEVLKDKILVMGLSHPAIDTRDAALFLPFRRSLRQRPNVMIPLVTLVNEFMGRNIGLHGETPIEEARASLDLFRSCEQIWEGIVKSGAWPCALPPAANGNCFT
ncbi:hypothetical protein NLI96_g7233 [Meripilus lineatus]|uniref:Exonuclease domain-containing protein n=1 Tax=Meripilus lineatus TaxID=2056292 RepID=A0AAD5UZW7_9APHY|nr:hypothetical protein NLI96_g7233 [Physisporinus lineatus]